MIGVQDPQNRDLNATDTWAIVDGAIKDVLTQQGPGKPIRAEALMKRANELAAAHFRRAPCEFALVSSLSVASLPVKPLRVELCEVSPLPDRQQFPYPKSAALQASGTPLERHLESTQYRLVKVKTEGRTVHEAAETALETLNLLRAVWTLCSTYESWSFSGGVPTARPTGVIHIGPIHTLHHPDGSLVDDIYWCELDYAGDQKLFDPKNGWERIEQSRGYVLRRVGQSLYKNELKGLLLRYVGALDQRNPDIALLQMWGILEKLTNKVGADYDELIQRTTRFDSQRDVEREVLRSLRCTRNRFVHSGKTAEVGDQIVFLIKSIIDPHLIRLIRNDLRVKDLQEYAEYLKLPDDAKTLKRRRRQLSRAIRISQQQKQGEQPTTAAH